jgi:cobalt-zinc-cadmium resistance protein CzcA
MTEIPEQLEREEESERASGVHRIVTGALAQPVLVGVLAVTLIAVGIWSFTRLPIDAYPDLSPPQKWNA